MPTPVIKDDYIYGVCSYGELRCLEADDRQARLWMTPRSDDRRDERGALGQRLPRAARATASSCSTRRAT